MERLKNLKVEDFETDPIVVSPTAPISEVIGALKQSGAYEVFIQDGKKVGALTMREILKASDISNMRTSTLMFYVSKLSPETTVGKAAKLMNDYRVRALPIVENGKIRGAVTTRSLCRALLSAKALRDVRVSKVMAKNPITIDKRDPVSKARRLMIKEGIDHLPVLDSRELCGILLSSHIVFSMFPREGLEKGAFVSKPSSYLHLKVSGLMNTRVLLYEPKEKALTVLRRMIEHGETYSIVKLWHELQGIVTYRDFIFFLAEPEKLDIPAYITGLPDEPFEAELAKIKFMRGAKSLRRSFPEIEEIRATVKARELSGDRHRYEVKVSVRSAEKLYIYSEEGWDLPSIFDAITDKLKKILTKKSNKRSRKSLRKFRPQSPV